MTTTPNQNSKRLGYILIGIAALLTISLIAGDGAGWLVIAAIAAGFLYFYRENRLPGLVVPGGILAGISAGIVLDSVLGFDTAFLIGLAGGFYLITRLEPKRHAWAIYPAYAMLGIVVLNFVSDSPWVFILGMFALGIYFLNRNKTNCISSSPATSNIEVSLSSLETTPPTVEAQTSNNFHTALARLDRLKAWRSNIAAQNQIEVQDVLSDAQLEHLAHAQVSNLEGLQDTLEIAQLVKYGQAVLAILQ